jgi:bifunctional DNA-binding transcriptional regulator/antitoxin component of YhaV-PrlF toxin-antitoxin module
MEVMTTITPKFQVHIPVAIRKKVGLTKHGRAIIKAEKGKIIIQPIKSDFMSLAGKFHVKNPLPVEKIRDYIDYSNI